MAVWASVFIGGGIGSLLRWLVCGKIGSHWGVMTVNVLGALIIGAAFQFFALKSGLRPEMKAFVMTGLLGGFTTFSTYMLDFGNLLESERWFEGWLYLLASLGLGICFLFLGLKLGKICFA